MDGQMKNPVFQVTQAERLNYMRSLFKTDLKDYFPVQTLLGNASLVPVIFYEPIDPVRERGNFTTWWNCIPLRVGEYTNDNIHDMYLIHELYHLANKVDGFSTPMNWKFNKLQEEFEAALYSEMDIYRDIPGLRSKTFDFPILADEVAIWGSKAYNRQYRRTVTARGSMNTPAQKLMQQYSAANYAWLDIYITIAPQVEEHNLALNQTGDFEAHIKWLDSNGKDIPFEWLLNVFNRSYAKIKEEFKP
jgi:hypothetical protein